jgi:hypothetical protein
MKSLRVFTCLLFVFLSRLTYANNDTLKLKQFADSLFIVGDYFEASVYYQKLDFFLMSEHGKNQAKLSAANANKILKRYDNAINILNTISLNDVHDSLIFGVKYQCALLNYLKNDFLQVEVYLNQLNYLVADSNYTSKSWILHALNLNEQYKWDEAKEKLLILNSRLYKNDSLVYTRIKKELDGMYAANQLPKLKSANRAIKMSSLIPGLGQCYTKNYGEGIASFISVASSVGIMAAGIVFQFYFTGIATGNMLLGKFYLGGIKRSEFLAEKYNYTIAKSFNQGLKLKIKQQFIP